MKNSLKRLHCLIIAVVTLCLISCSDIGGGVIMEQAPKIPHYFTPVVTVSKSGLATWKDLEGAEEFIYSINGGEEIKTKEKQVQLSLNDTIKVKCVGDGTTRQDSRWSSTAQYIPAHSFAIDGSGARSSAMNVYLPDGTIVLDNINGTKVNGDVMTANQEYIIEIDISVGAYPTALMIAGVENAVLSDLTWSNCNYNERQSEVADTTDHFHEVYYNKLYDLYPNYAAMHRLTWSYTGEYFKNEDGIGLKTYGWHMKDQPALNDNGVYDTATEGFWTIEPNWCSTLYGAHVLSSKRQSKEQSEAGYKFVRFKLMYRELRSCGVGAIAGVEQYDILDGKEGFNLYTSIKSDSMLFFNSDVRPEHEARDKSFATNDYGKAANDVTVYDAESGNVIFANGEQGELLEAGKKYIIETDVRGDANGRICFTGIQNALISDVTWSDKRYSERDGESAKADGLCVLELDSASHHLASERPLFHRLWKSADGYTGNFTNDCVPNADGRVDTTFDSNRSHDNNRCLEFALKSWLASKLTSKQADRQYYRMTIEWRDFTTIQVGHPIEDRNDPNYGNLAGAFFNMFIYSPAGGRYLYLTSYAPQ